MKPKMVKLIHTCTSCPAQWEGQDELGYWYYFRFRWDRLQVYKSKSTINLFDYVDSEIIKTITGHTGNGYNGALSTEEMQELTSDVLDWSGDCQVKRDYPE